MPSLPESTKSLVLTGDGKIEMRSVELPKVLDNKKVLVKMVLSPVLPYDQRSLQRNRAAGRENLGLGAEGLGVVMETGPGVTSLRTGDHVIVLYTVPGVGTWRQVAVFDEEQVCKISVDSIPLEHAANIYINPVTAFGILKVKTLTPGDVIIQNAANSSLGRQIIKIAHDRGLKTVNVIREQENFTKTCDELKHLGADAVITYEQLSRDGLPSNIEDKPKLALDLVGSDKTMLLARQLQTKGVIVCPSWCSGEMPKIDSLALLINSIGIQYFNYRHWTTVEEFRNEVVPFVEKKKLPFPECEKVEWTNIDRALEKAGACGGNRRILLEIC